MRTPRKRRKPPALDLHAGGLVHEPEVPGLEDELATLGRFLDGRPATAPIVLGRLGELGAEARIDLKRLRAERSIRLRRLPSAARRRRAAARVAAMFAFAFGGALLAASPASAQTTSLPGVQRASQGAFLMLKVLDTGTGKPLPGVRIKTVGDDIVGVTDSAGQVQLAPEFARESVLSLEREGYPIVLLEGTKLTGHSLVGMRRFNDSGAKGAAAAGLRLGGAGARPAAGGGDDPAERLFKLSLEHSKARAPYSEAEGKGDAPVTARPRPAASVRPEPPVAFVPTPPPATPRPVPVAALPTPAPTAKPLPVAAPATPKPITLAELPTPAPTAKPLPVAAPATPKPITLAELPTPAPTAKPLPVAAPATPKPAPLAALPTARPQPAATPAPDLVADEPAPTPRPRASARPEPASIAARPSALDTPTLRPQRRVAKIAAAESAKNPRGGKALMRAEQLAAAAPEPAPAVQPEAPAPVAAAPVEPQPAPGARPSRTRKQVAKVASADTKAPRAIRVVLRNDGPEPPPDPLDPANQPPARPVAVAQAPANPDALALLGEGGTPTEPVAVAQPGPVEPPLGNLPAVVEPRALAPKPKGTELAGPAAVVTPPVRPTQPGGPAGVAGPAVPYRQDPHHAAAAHGNLRLAPRRAPEPQAQAYLPFPLPRAFSGSQVTTGADHGIVPDTGLPVDRPAVTVKLPSGPKLPPVRRRPEPAAVAWAPERVAAAPDAHGHAHDGEPMDDLGADAQVLPRHEDTIAPSRPAPRAHGAPARRAPVAVPHRHTSHGARPAATHGGQTHASQGEHHGGSLSELLRGRGAAPPAHAVSTRKALRVTVEPGDTLSHIALRELGSATLWPVIYHANRDTLVDPHWLRVGTVLKVPRTSAALSAAGARVHVVEPGDSLWGIARTHLGDPSKWPKIYAVNRHIIRNPWLIFPGQRLVLPTRIASGVSEHWADLSATPERPARSAPRTAAAE